MQAAFAKRTGDCTSGEQAMAVNCPVCPKENPALGLPVSHPKCLALAAPRHYDRLCKATILSTPLSRSHVLICLLANVTGLYTIKSPTDTVFPRLMRFPCHHSAQQLHPPFLPSFLLPLLPSTTTLSLLPPLCMVTTERQAQELSMTPSLAAAWLGIHGL